MPIDMMVHLNGHRLCAIDVETTGLDHSYHEIVQVSMIALNEKLDPHPGYQIFDVLVKPLYPERASKEAIRKIGRDKFNSAVATGYDPTVAFELWENWFQSLSMGEGRRVTPLGYNYANFDSNFLRQWAGFETYNYYFDTRVRDPFLIANWFNDRADFAGEKQPFPNLKLRQICRKLGVPFDPDAAHDSLYDAQKTAEAYKKLMTEIIV